MNTLRRFSRYPLLIVLFFALLFDLQEALSIRMHGFPPNDFLEPAPGGGFFIGPTMREQINYGLFLAGVVLVQLVILRMTVKAWRASRQTSVSRAR